MHTKESAAEQISDENFAQRFLLIWGGLSLLMFLIAAVLTGILVRVSILEGNYNPIGMYGNFSAATRGWIYFEHGHGTSDFLVYYPAGTRAVALPSGKLKRCWDGTSKTGAALVSGIASEQWEKHAFYRIDVSRGERGTPKAGAFTCQIAFAPRRESFTSFTTDVWFLPTISHAGEPIATLNFSATLDDADNMQVFGARSTSSSGADMEPDDEAVVRYTDIRREGLRDVALVLIGAFVALGAAMALEAIRPYIEATAGRRLSP